MLGIDVHQDKGNPDWRQAFAAGVRFAWLKVSEGAGGNPNPAILAWYQHNAPLARAAGIRIGGYHFLTTAITSSTPIEEAEFFTSRLSLKDRDLLPVCDFEQEPPDPLQALTFLQHVERELGVKPILYTFPNYLNRALGRATPAAQRELKRFPLWFADYGRNDGRNHGITHDTHGFTVVAHQFTSRGTIAGVASPTDMNNLLLPSLRQLTFHAQVLTA